MSARNHPHYDRLNPHQQGLADLLAVSQSEESLVIPTGWGKTPTLIVAAESALAGGVWGPAPSDGRLLIVTNKVMIAHWLDTWGRFGGCPASERLGPPDSGRVLITSYENLSRNADAYLAVPWARAVLDEPTSPLGAATPTRKQQTLRELRAQTPCWIVGHNAPRNTPLTEAMAYLLGDVPLPPYTCPGPRSRPSLLAERVS